MGKIAKAVYAAIMAGVTAAVSIYTDVDWLVIALAALTAIGVYIVPNAAASDPR